MHAQTITGQQLLEKNIQYHNPKGKWDNFKGTQPLTETRPNRANRKSVLKFDNEKPIFI